MRLSSTRNRYAGRHRHGGSKPTRLLPPWLTRDAVETFLAWALPALAAVLVLAAVLLPFFI